MTRSTLHLALWTGLFLAGTMPLVWMVWALLFAPRADVLFDFPAPVRAGETRTAPFVLAYPERLSIQYRATKANVRDEQRCAPHAVLWWRQWACTNARFQPALRWEVLSGGHVVAKGSQRGALTSMQDDDAEAVTFTTGEIRPHGRQRFELAVTAHNDLTGLQRRHARIIVTSPPMLRENKAWLLFGAGVVLLFVIGVPLSAVASNAEWSSLRRRR